MVRVSSEPVSQMRRVRPPHVALLGLLAAAIFLGSMDVAVRTGTQPQPEQLASAKIQDRLIAVVADSQGALQTSTSPGVAKPLHTSDPSASNPISDVTEGFSVSNIHPTNGFIKVHATRPASPTNPDAGLSSTPPSQSRAAANPHLVSVPTRKPKRPMYKEAHSAEPKAEPATQAGTEPKPLAFGSIGYNYNPQQ
jgi:hypothetical protein